MKDGGEQRCSSRGAGFKRLSAYKDGAPKLVLEDGVGRWWGGGVYRRVRNGCTLPVRVALAATTVTGLANCV